MNQSNPKSSGESSKVFRCVFCGKTLFFYIAKDCLIDIKCLRCRQINLLEIVDQKIICKSKKD